jgi:MtN3 and saliva related transmembrane protein
MNPILLNGVGVVAAVCSMASFVPQVVKIAREKDASSVSLRMYVVTVSGFACWTLYGVLLKSWPLAGSNVVCLTLAAIVLALKLKYGNGRTA